MKLNLTIFLLVFLLSCRPENQKAPEDFSALQAKIDSVITHSTFNGVVLLTQGADTIYSKAQGFSDLETKTSLKTEDQFVIGSISKQVTAVLVLQAFEKGKLDLNDTIARYLPEISQPWSKEITIHHLLTHTHGIVTMDEPLAFAPGSQFHYSQLGYDLLAQVLEKITGQTFEALSTNLFAQHGLSATFHPDDTTYRKLVKGYEKENGRFVFAPNSLQNYAAAGSFISNAPDLIKWNALLHSEALVRKETLALMKVNYATRRHPVFGSVEYGYGLLFNEGEENIQIGALGYVPGFVTASYYYPQSKMNLVVLENTVRGTEDFKKTFQVHTGIMDAIKNESMGGKMKN